MGKGGRAVDSFGCGVCCEDIPLHRRARDCPSLEECVFNSPLNKLHASTLLGACSLTIDTAVRAYCHPAGMDPVQQVPLGCTLHNCSIHICIQICICIYDV